MRSKTESLANTAEPSTIEAATPNHTVWDRVGIAGSLLCVIHCAVTPLAIGYLSVMGLEFLGNDLVHQVLAVFLLCIALLAFIPGFRGHGNRLVIAIGALGISVLFATHFVLEHFVGYGLEMGLTIIGSLLLVGAHTANWRLASQGDECCDATNKAHPQ